MGKNTVGQSNYRILEMEISRKKQLMKFIFHM